MTQPSSPTLPHWDMTSVYPSLDSPEFQADFEKFSILTSDLEAYIKGLSEQASLASTNEKLAEAAAGLIDRINAAATLSYTLRSYLTGFTAVDSFNTTARRIESQYQAKNARLDELITRFRSWAGTVSARLPEIIAHSETARQHSFALQEAAERSRYQMSASEEALASELSLSGGHAWNRLHGTITSQLSVDFELDGEVHKMAMPALVNLRSHPEESVRRRGYEAELTAWASVREPLAAALNGIKGEVISLNKRRHRPDALHSALEMARIDRDTLDTMLGAMVDSFPAFRRYFQAKARRIGKKKLAWWDLFAPAVKSERKFNWAETQEFILENFAGFSSSLTDFARQAFDQHWIDAEPRPGKRGGAFCMGLPAVKESRVLANFDGSLDQVSTMAHELGHAFHNSCIYAAGKTALQSRTPMTLAETASIMNETIVQQAALARASSKEEELSILETALIGDSMVIVDIYSRFLFEREVFNRREKAELSADELCEIMAWAQKETYGDGLDERYLQPYMWTWKPHYYYPDLSFYNFPYAFGLLFGVGLYAIYQQRGAAFVPDYQNLLASTGEDNATNLAARFGIDIRQKDFWVASLKVIEARIDRYTSL
ncbi:MAG: M3 family oligoendopeptidase [Anaerolineaceae bacterium]|nr:M3 family oligoendopeptidase [Anaerolineaceae bacterium]